MGKLMKTHLVSLVLVACMSNAQAEKPLAPTHIPGATSLTAETAVELILSTPELVVIDARKQEEFAAGHIEGAVSMLNTTMTPESLASVVPDKDTPILFYCNGERCMRSTEATNKALGWGYTTVYWFRGGWKEWTEKQMPIAK